MVYILKTWEVNIGSIKHQNFQREDTLDYLGFGLKPHTCAQLWV